MSLVWSLDRVTQVVMDGLFHPFHFVEKQYSRTRSAELQGLTSVYTQGRIIFYYSHGICFRGLLIENNCFNMEWVLLLFLYGTKSRENNGPNGQPAQCKTPSECYKNRYIRRYWPATNWILCLGFCCGSTVCDWWGAFFLFTLNILNLSGLVWFSWPKYAYGSHYYFFKIAR